MPKPFQILASQLDEEPSRWTVPASRIGLDIHPPPERIEVLNVEGNKVTRRIFKISEREIRYEDKKGILVIYGEE